MDSRQQRTSGQQTYNLPKIAAIAVDRFDEIATDLGISYKTCERHYYGVCPVHGGNNGSAWNLYRTGQTSVGNWVCNTHHCEKVHGNSFFGFIQGVKGIQFIEAVKYVIKLLRINTADSLTTYTDEEQDKKKFVKSISVLQKRTGVKNSSSISKEKVRAALQIPSSYFIKRGYRADILEKYDVGDCLTPGKSMMNRAVVPIYDENGQFVGCSGRSIYDKCEKCGNYHYPTAPTCMEVSKWKNSDNFYKTDFLYNFANAKSFILDSETAIIVESPGDLWRLEEADFHNGLSLLGSDISDNQLTILARTGAMRLIVLMNMDEAGLLASEKIRKKCDRTYRLIFPAFPKNDLGDCTIEEVKCIINSVL